MAITLPCLSTASNCLFLKDEEEGVLLLLDLGSGRGLVERGLGVVVAVIVPAVPVPVPVPAASSLCSWLLLGDEDGWSPFPLLLAVLLVFVSDILMTGGGDDSTVESSLSSSPLFLGVVEVRDDRGRPRLRRFGRLDAILVVRLLLLAAADALEVVSPTPTPPPVDVLRRRVGRSPPNGLVMLGGRVEERE
jgi:hypothetical protein